MSDSPDSRIDPQAAVVSRAAAARAAEQLYCYFYPENADAAAPDELQQVLRSIRSCALRLRTAEGDPQLQLLNQISELCAAALKLSAAAADGSMEQPAAAVPLPGREALDGAVQSTLLAQDRALEPFVQEFLKGLTPALQALQRALEREEGAKLALLAGKLQGEAALYGFPKCSRLLLQLKAAAEQRQFSEARRAADALHRLQAEMLA